MKNRRQQQKIKQLLTHLMLIPKRSLATAKKMPIRQILKQKEQRNQEKLLQMTPTISIKTEHTKAPEPDTAEPSPYR